MTRIGSLVLGCLALVIGIGLAPVAVSAQDLPKETFVSVDGLFSFEYPATWTRADLPTFVRLRDTAGEVPDRDLRVDVIYPGSGGMTFGTYAGLDPAGIVDEFRIAMASSYTIGPTAMEQTDGNAVAYATTQGSDPARGPLDILLMAVDLGGNHRSLIYAESPVGAMIGYLPELLTLAGSETYSGPPIAAPEAPPVREPQLPDDESTPEEPVVVESPAEAAPQPQPPITTAAATGRVHLLYADGTMTIYNGSDAAVSIEGLALVAPDTGERFTSHDFGWFTQRVFAPQHCIYLHVNVQAYSAPSYCWPTGTRQLTYLFANSSGRFFVWNPQFATLPTFQVVRGEELLATCSIAAGECAFDAPVRYIPYEPFQ